MTIPVCFLLLPGSLVLDWTGPAEAFRIANQLETLQGREPPFELEFVGPCTTPSTPLGLSIAGVKPLPAKLRPGSWLVLVGMPGDRFDPDAPHTRTALHWLRTLGGPAPGGKLVTVCAGAVIAAHAGWLQGCRATTHHQHLDELRELNAGCEVVSNRVFVLDGCVASSAGITTGIDLALHLVAQACGAPLAARVAQTMVVALRRGPHDPELSPFFGYRNHLHPVLHRVQDAVAGEPQREWSVPVMAAVGHTSPRHLTRLFIEHAGIPPLQYLRRIRLSVAQAALASGRNVTQAAELAGFSSDTQLRRTWHQMGLPETPRSVASLQKG